MLVVKATDAEWRALHEAADRIEPRVRRAFLNAVSAMRDRINIGLLTDALELGDVDRALRAIQTTLPAHLLRDIQDALAELTQRAAVIAEAHAAFTMSFTLVNEHAADWASRHAAELVTNISIDTRQTIRDLVTRSITEGIPPRVQARTIQQVVGLTERDALAVKRRFDAMLEDAGLNRKLIAVAERQRDRYATKLLRVRAENIARTEAIKSANMGQQLLWEQAAAEGLLDPDAMRRVWIATPDGRVCPRCESLDGVTVTLFGEFTEAEETAPKSGPVTTLTPALHPSCRCALGLVEVT